MLPFTCESNRLHFSFDAAFTEAAGDQHTVVPAEQSFGAFAFDVSALDAADPNLGLVLHARMVDRFVNRFVGVFVLGVLTDHGDVKSHALGCEADAANRPRA